MVCREQSTRGHTGIWHVPCDPHVAPRRLHQLHCHSPSPQAARHAQQAESVFSGTSSKQTWTLKHKGSSEPLDAHVAVLLSMGGLSKHISLPQTRTKVCACQVVLLRRPACTVSSRRIINHGMKSHKHTSCVSSLLPSVMQRALVVDHRVERQRVVMQQLAEMRHSASSLQERVAKLSGDVHPRMLGQVHEPPTLLLPVGKRHTVQRASMHCSNLQRNLYRSMLRSS